ncbi:hypothetical protein [Nonomuraea cavernae]|uniref:hypothetical protein n=1 Tax=Nonomuraea cavernae TaxID=2045107 RepID=UPI0033E6A5FB
MTEATVRDSHIETPSDSTWQGVSRFLDDYPAIRADDKVFILYTLDARAPAAWLAAELTTRGITSGVGGMNPVDDDGLEARLRDALPDPRDLSSRLVVLTVERDSMSHSLKLRRALAPYDEASVAVYRLINASSDFFERAVNATPQVLSAINGALLNRMMPASHLRIQTPSGTDLEVSTDTERYRWLSNRGLWRQGTFVITPSGEVSTYPADINGVLVADGAFNVTAYTETDARLHDNPVTLQIEKGRVVAYTCDSPAVSKLIDRCLERPNADRIGELGFGTNIGVSGFIRMNSHINERHPGVHLGLGQHGQKIDAVSYMCDIHLDLIAPNATITVDHDTVIETHDLARYATEEHPPILDDDIDDQDIDGDCCGVIAREVAKAREDYERSCRIETSRGQQQ